MPRREHMYRPMELAMRAVLDIQEAKSMPVNDHAIRMQSLFGVSRASAYRLVALSAYVLNKEFPAISWDSVAERTADKHACTGTRPGPKRRNS